MAANSSALVRSVAAGARRLAAVRWLRPLNDPDALDDLLGLVDPLWSVARVRARVVRVIDETADTRTFVLYPNGHWRGFAPGQYVCVDVDIDGVRHQRTYSVSSAPGDRGTIAITVKRQPGGRVSGFLHDAVRPGDVLGLSQAAGRFVLPDPVPARVVLLSAGSGITPVMSMVRHLHARAARTDVVLVHSCRSFSDAIFGRELRARARTWPALRPHLVFTAETGRLDGARLARLVPDWATRDGFVCGPDGFMEAVRSLWRSAGLEHRLRFESFGGAPAARRVTGGAATVTCARSGAAFRASADRPLLVEAERAGLRPRFGCRMGICHTCVVRKVSGTVENLATGAVTSDPDTMIQLCVSAPRSDVTLAL
jgi:ferredoxin-NADP reductase